MARRLAHWGTWIGRPWIVLAMAAEKRRWAGRPQWKGRPHEVVIGRVRAPRQNVPWWAIARVVRHKLGDDRKRLHPHVLQATRRARAVLGRLSN